VLAPQACIVGYPVIINNVNGKNVNKPFDVDSAGKIKDTAENQKLLDSCLCVPTDSLIICNKYIGAGYFSTLSFLGEKQKESLVKHFNNMQNESAAGYISKQDMINEVNSLEGVKNEDKNSILLKIDGLIKERDRCIQCTTFDESNKSTGYYTGIGCINTTFNGFIGQALRFGFGLTGIFMSGNIIFASFQIQMGKGDPKLIQTAQGRITSAIYGILLIIFAIFFLEFIGVKILGFNYLFR
jgi:hypothetical protein